MTMKTTNNFLPPCVGTKLKLSVTAQLPGNLHLSDVEFYCNFYVTGATAKRQKFEKTQMREEDNDTWSAVVDTEVIGSGEYWCQLTVLLPDQDCANGERPEIVRFPCKVKVLP